MPIPHNFVLQIFANVLGRNCKIFRAVQSFITLFICLLMQISLILKNSFGIGHHSLITRIAFSQANRSFNLILKNI